LIHGMWRSIALALNPQNVALERHRTAENITSR